MTVLLFDIDSTLVENRFSLTAIGEVLQEISDTSGKSVRQLGSEIGRENERRQHDDPDNLLTMDWDDILETIAAREGVTLTKTGITLWNQYAHADAVEVLDHAADVLYTLRAQGYTLVIATKGLWKYQEPVLRVTGLLPLFDAFITPDKAGFLKTSPGYVTGIRAQYPDHPFVHIGDHYYDDVICAKRNGFLSILRAPIASLSAVDALERPALIPTVHLEIPTYPTAGTDIRPDALILSLEELPELLPRLVSEPTAGISRN